MTVDISRQRCLRNIFISLYLLIFAFASFGSSSGNKAADAKTVSVNSDRETV